MAQPPWHVRWEGGGAFGWSLWDLDRAGIARLWLAADRYGVLHTCASWQQEGLSWARVRLPGGEWLELIPRAGRHPLWGACDLIGNRDARGARIPAQDYLRLPQLPPLDRPAALPPGGGAALLNFLARLMAARGADRVRYRGPYPTAHLFDALDRSFAWLSDEAALGPPADDRADPQQRPALVPPEWSSSIKSLPEQRARMRARFSANEWPAELDASPAAWDSPELRWRPDPWVWLQPQPGLAVHWRRGPETVWLGSRRFEAGGRGAPPGSCRVWPLAEGGYAAGLLLLGQPWRVFVRLDETGHPFHFAPPRPEATVPSTPMPDPWRAVIFAWAAVATAPALAAAVAELEHETALAWAPLAADVVQLDPTPDRIRLRIQSGIAAQFRKLAAEGRAPGELALMAVSDVAGGADAALRRLAQQRLAVRVSPEPDELVRRGVASQEQGRACLQRELPGLVTALSRGEGWGV